MPPKTADPEHDRWLDEIISLTEAASLRKISIDTLRSEIRAGRLKAIKLSERRRGMTRREALRDPRGG
jgi:predicted site-specific integrase-resolvase